MSMFRWLTASVLLAAMMGCSSLCIQNKTVYQCYPYSWQQKWNHHQVYVLERDGSRDGQSAEARILVSAPGQRDPIETSFSFEGFIQCAWVTDMDEDGAPEVSVFTQTESRREYGELHVFELEGDRLAVRPLSPFSPRDYQYKGEDYYDVWDDAIVHVFPTHKVTDIDSDPTGGVRWIEYQLKKDKWAYTLEHYPELAMADAGDCDCACRECSDCPCAGYAE
ncbi:MAG: hypothetical protein GC154_11330 [bacterium]|nr:hypothetical protein [bacterium]